MSQWAPRLRCNEARLARLFSSHPIKVVFTVGDWLGWGKRYFASLIPPEGKVYAVDQGACMEKTELSVYERFLSDALYSGYEHQMQQIRLRSVDAVDYLSSLVPDLIYLDACRDLYAELRLWYPLVQGRGVLCGNESQPVLYQFAQERGVRVEEDAHFWRIVE